MPVTHETQQISRLAKVLHVGLAAFALLLAGQSFGAARIIRANNMTMARGDTNRLYVTLESLGDENALGFSLCFDKSLLTFVSARRGADVLAAPQYIPNTNANQATNGRIGVLMGLTPPETFAAGTNAIWEVVFRATPGGGSTVTTVSLCNSPVARGVVDGSDDVNELPASYVDATVFIQGTCSYAINTNAASFSAAMASSSVNVTAEAGCDWAVENTNAWISIVSSTNGVVNYNVAANASLSARTGTFIVAGQTFTVSQAGYVCAYFMAPGLRHYGSGASTDSIDLITSDLCAWTVVNSNDWITILSATNGMGSMAVEYAVAANPNLLGRTGSVMIADRMLTIVQDPFQCSYQLSAANAAHGAGTESNSVNVIAAAACDWIATSTNNWITLLAGAAGPGNKSVGYLVAANPSGALRSGAIFVADQVFAITQAGAACDAALTPLSRSHGFGSETGLVNVALPGGCNWQVVNTNSWITIDSGAVGVGNGTIGYTAASNTTFVARSGVLVIAGVNFTVAQAPAPCLVSLSPTNGIYGAGMETGSVSVTIGSGCAWNAVNTNSWITILSDASGLGNGTVVFTVTANPDLASRSATLWVDGSPFVINQAGYQCRYELLLTNFSCDFTAHTNTANVTAGPVCTWTATTTNDWITVLSGANGTGAASFTYSILPNGGAGSRTGFVMVADQVLAVTQSASTNGFVFDPIVKDESGNLLLKLNGGPAGLWEIQTSSDMVTWARLTDVTNTTGRVELTVSPTGDNARFYRAILR